MKESFIEKLRRWVRNPTPRRIKTQVAVWWEWGGRTYRLRRHDGRVYPPKSGVAESGGPQ